MENWEKELLLSNALRVQKIDSFEKAITEDLAKGKAATIGEIRIWNGKKYKKQPNGKWLEVSEHGMARREHEQEIKYHQKVEENRGNEISDRRKAQDEQDKHHKAASKLSDKEFSDEEVGLGGEKKNQSSEKKDFKEMSFSERLSALKDAPNGAIASGGGYGPFIKIGKNSWQNKVTKTLMHSEALRAHIGGFNDFKIK